MKAIVNEGCIGCGLCADACPEGAVELVETTAEALLPACDPYVRVLYERSADSSMGRWLMMEVTSEDILRDAEALMLLRAAPKGARS